MEIRMCEKKYEKTKKLMNQLYTWKYLFDFEKWVYGNKQDRRDLEEFFDFLDEIILVEYQEDYLVTMNIGTKFYRARVIEFDDYKKIEKGIGYDADRLRGYNWEESKEPPDGSNKEQRNSKKGEIALYVADDEVTACAEVKSEVRQYISLAEFELSENEIKQYNYEISFLDDNSFKINMGSGNSVQGNYVVSDDIITCNLTHASGEYSPTQEINGKISFKINSNSDNIIIKNIKEFLETIK